MTEKFVTENSPQCISIGFKRVGEGQPCLLIGEVAQNHDGSLGLAHAYIDSIADVGADAVKFQTHIADAESTIDEEFRVKFSFEDETRFNYWKRMEFTQEQWKGLAEHASDRGLLFLSSAFSIKAFNLLSSLGMVAWKIGSGEFSSHELIEAMINDTKPIIVSTGMNSWDEISTVVDRLRSKGCPFVLLQCTSLYPTPLEKVGLNVVSELREKYSCPTGLSDHSGSIFPSLRALATGANMLEVHVTLDRRMFGPDVSSSVTVDELGMLVKARDAFMKLANHPVDKNRIVEELDTVRNLFTKSVAPSFQLYKGTVIEEEMLAPKKPGFGIPFSAREKLVGRRLRNDIPPDRLIKWQDIE